MSAHAPTQAGWIAAVVIGDDTEFDTAAAQFAACAALPGVRRAGVIASQVAMAAHEKAIVALDADFVITGYWHTTETLGALRHRSNAATPYVLICFADHELSSEALGGFLEYHAGSGSSESEFTPGIFETWRLQPLARAYTATALPVTPSGPAVETMRLLRKGEDRLRKAAHAHFPWVGPLYRPARRALSDMKQAALRLQQKRDAAEHAGLPDISPQTHEQPVVAPPVSAPAPPPKTPGFLGTTKDQIELMVDRVDEFYPFPRVVNLVLTNLCNLKCVMCPYHSPAYPDVSGYMSTRRYMPEEMFERIAKEAAANGSWLKMGQLEEVFMHPKLIPMIRKAHELGVPYLHITTNGTLLNSERSTALIESGLTRINVSIDAIKPGTYKNIRGWDLNRLTKNVQELIAIRDRLKSKTEIYVAMILQDQAVEEEQPFIDFWRSQGADGAVVYQLSEHHHGDNHFRAKYFDHTPPAERHACQSVWQECYVYPEGEVSTCCTTMILVPQKGIISVGNVNQNSIKDIWLGEQYSNLRRRLILNDIADDPACKDCDIWAACEVRSERRDGYLLEMNPTMAVHNFTR